MKSPLNLARGDVRRLKPCVHGGEVWDIANEKGLRLEDLLDYSSSINPLGPSPKALDAIKASFRQVPFYPDSDSSALREAIAHRFGLGKDNVVVGNGSTEPIYLFAEAFMDAGDQALIVEPTFGEYERAVRKVGGRVKHVVLGRGFEFGADVVKRHLRGAKAVFLCNPNNPTSMLVRRGELVEVLEAAKSLDVLVFLDEDFIEFVDAEKQYSLVGEVERFPNLFVLRTFTKFHGLTGLRVGYGVASEDVVEVLCKAKMPWSVNCFAQVAALAALGDEEHARRTREIVRVERKFLTHELSKISGVTVYPADANYIFSDIRESGFTAPQLKAGMLQRGILIRDCSSFWGLDEFYVRVSVRTRQENERLVAAFKEILC
jgi:threonine-phosphate decarboxylase